MTSSPEQSTATLVSKYKCKEKCYSFRCELKIKNDEHWETKLWNFVKHVPIINVVYGIPRCVMMMLTGQWTDSFKTLAKVIGGTGEIFIFTQLGTVGVASSFAVALGRSTTALCIGSIVGSVGALLEMQVDQYVFEQNNLQENATEEEQQTYWTENRVYHGVIKNIAVLGPLYSIVRAAYKKNRGKHEEAYECRKDAIINILVSLVSVGIMAKVGQMRANEIFQPKLISARSHAEAIAKTVPTQFQSIVNFQILEQALGRAVSESMGLLPSRALVLHFIAANFIEAGYSEAEVATTVKEYKKSPVDPEKVLESLYNVNCKINWNIRTRDAKFKYMAKCIIQTFLGIAPITPICTDYLIKSTKDCILTGEIGIVQTIINFVPAEYWVKYSNRLFLDRIIYENEKLLIQYMIKLMSQDTSTVTFPLQESSEYSHYEFVKAEAIQSVSSNFGGLNVLCLDGGGVRGLFSIEILNSIAKQFEAHLELKDSESVKFSIKNVFDYVAGTSTGGIIALGLATNHSLDEMTKLYFELKDKIFTGTKSYNAINFENILKEFFGSNTRMGDIQGIRIIIPAVTGPSDELGIKLFTNFDKDTMNEEIWKVARRTSAAPTFFDPMVETSGGSFYDGGVKANNPTYVALRKIHNKHGLKHGLVLSLGTGRYRGDNQTLPVCRDDLPSIIVQQLTGELNTIRKMFINALTQCDGTVIESDAFWCKQLDCSYFRFSPTLSEDLGLDETDDFRIINGLIQTKAFLNMKENTKIIYKLTKNLLKTANSSKSRNRLSFKILKLPLCILILILFLAFHGMKIFKMFQL